MSQPSDFAHQATHWRRWAPFYDNDSDGHLHPGPPVELLAEFANGGPALELGIGTGRLALPLARQGIPITGIDASPEMLARLHENRGSLPVDGHLADMADFHLPGTFTLVYVAASTIFLLTTGERQASCFRSVAATLNADGRFVVEAALPSTFAANHQQVIVRHIDDDHVRLTVQVHDPIAQRVVSQEIRLQNDGTWRMLPSAKRYASPAELDLMAQLAGLHLHARYGGWDRSPFSARSNHHVSVYMVGPPDLGRICTRSPPRSSTTHLRSDTCVRLTKAEAEMTTDPHDLAYMTPDEECLTGPQRYERCPRRP